MSNPLIQHILKFISLDAHDQGIVVSHFEQIKLKKKEDVLRKGERCKANYFVVKGCLRMFFINDKGIEQTTQFAIENWWMTDYAAFQNRQQALFTIQAVENSQLLSISFDDQEKLLEKVPAMERYFRLIYQKAYAASQIGTMYRSNFSKSELYAHFSRSFPEFIQRIPQYLLASYLGFTPEYLSELRKQDRS